MDPETNDNNITHPYTSIKILFPDIVKPTGFKTMFILTLKNITFIKNL